MNTPNTISPGSITMSAISELKPVFSGRILIEGDAEYDNTRKIWNGMIDRKPSLIVQCKNKQDIQHAVNVARKYNMLVAVRGGGHNVSGNAVCDGGMMIDLSPMKTIKVNPSAKWADVEMGATWADLDQATQAYGLGTTGGVVSSTGVAGLTLGGGVGWLVRKYGMSCDNMMEAEIVTADGNIIKASLTENADLFWGLRGGGGNFGIVSSMKLRLHEVGTVLGGMILHTRDKAKEVLKFYRDFITTMPNELTLYAGLLTSPDGIPLVALLGCYCGDIETGQRVIKPLREFGTPIADLFQPMPYVQMQGIIEAGHPFGRRYYWKSGFLKELTDEAIDVVVSQAGACPSPYSVTLLELYGGVSVNSPEGGTAFPHRQPQVDLVIISHWPDAQGDDKNISWARQTWEAMQPFLNPDVYVNVLGVEGDDRVREAYGDNYQRLALLKRKYDPANFFRMNQNIKPAESYS